MLRKLLILIVVLIGGGLINLGCQRVRPLSSQSFSPATPPSVPAAATVEQAEAAAEIDADLLGLVTNLAPVSAGPVDAFGRFRNHPAVVPSPQVSQPTEQHSFADVGCDCDVDLDRTARLMVFASTRHSLASDLYLKRTDGVTVTQLTDDPANDVQPAFSPSGKQVAFASDRGGSWDLWLVDVDGRNRIRLTDSPAHELAPSWSPDGRRLAYCTFGQRSGQWEIWVLDLANPAGRRFLGFGLFPTWSPDRSVERLAYQRARQRGANDFSIWTMTLVDGEPRYPTEVAPATAGWSAISPAWSPDGRKLAFVEVKLPTAARSAGAAAATEPGAGDPPGLSRETVVLEPPVSALCVVDLDGSNRQRLVEGRGLNAGPAWAADGKLYFTSDRQGRESIFSVAAQPQSPIQQALKEAVLTNQPTAAVPTQE